MRRRLGCPGPVGTFAGFITAHPRWNAGGARGGQHSALIELVRLLARRAAAELMTQGDRRRKGRCR